MGSNMAENHPIAFASPCRRRSAGRRSFMSTRGSPAPRRFVTSTRRCGRGRTSPCSAASSITFSSTICGSRNTRSPFPTFRRLSTGGSKTPVNSTGSSPVGMKRAARTNTIAGNTRARVCRRHWPSITSTPPKALARRPSGRRRGRRPATRHCSIRIASTRSCAAITPPTRPRWSSATTGCPARRVRQNRRSIWHAIRAANAPGRSAMRSAGRTIRPASR